MISTTIKSKIYLEDLTLEEAQLIKHALLNFTQFGAERYGIDQANAMIGTIDQAVDQVMERKYAGKVFGKTANVEPANA